MKLEPVSELADVLSRHSVASPIMEGTAVPRLMIFRADHPTSRTPGIYQPLFCLVASGAKQVFFGHRTTRYAAGDCFLVTIDLPVVGTVLQAAPGKPYVAFCLALHGATLAEIALLVNHAPSARGSSRGLQGGVGSPEIVDAALRLARLLDNPADTDVLAPLYERELLFRLLVGPWGGSLYAASQANSRLSQVSRAIAWLHQNYKTDFIAQKLASVAGGMSVPTMNRYFREITAMSPLEYQKRIRLQEARRLLTSEQTDVSGAGYAVGYSSPSQFSREYRRLFGEAPGRDGNRLRNRIKPK